MTRLLAALCVLASCAGAEDEPPPPETPFDPDLPVVDGPPPDPDAPVDPDQPAPQDPVREAPLKVYTTSFPIDWLVGWIGAEGADHENILPAGQDAASWRPEGQQIVDLAAADLIVANGAGFEAWMATASLPESRVVETARDVALIELDAADHPAHTHGDEGEHTHAGVDPHTWADPETFLAQGAAIRDALAAADPAGGDQYGAAWDGLKVELDALSAELAAALAPAAGVPLAANHPAYNYLARRYGLDVRSFDFDPEVAPDAAQLQAFQDWRAGREAPILLWEDAPADAVAAAFPPDVRHVRIDPLEQPNAAGDYDYLAQSRANAATFQALFAP